MAGVHKSKRLTPSINVLAYRGVNAEAPPEIWIGDRRPLTTDYNNFVIGDFWVYNPDAGLEELWVLVAKKPSSLATWIMLGGGAGSILNVLAGPNINVNVVANVATVALNQVIRWTDTTADGLQGAIYLGGTDGAGGSLFMHNFGDAGNTDANTFLGFDAGNLTTTATDLTGIGYNSLKAVTSGNENTGVGSGALEVVTSGSQNVAVGSSALTLITTQSFNTAVGHQALAANLANDNVAVGWQALALNTTGTSNVAVGLGALSTNVTTSKCTAIGHNALEVSISDENTSVGFESMLSNTTGTQNLAVGNLTLRNNIIGDFNTSVGYSALASNLADSNTAVGWQALGLNTTGTTNSAVGVGALSSNIVGSRNTAMGMDALGAVTNTDNTAFGYKALGLFTTAGDVNSAFGSLSLSACTTGSGNTALGYKSMQNASTSTVNLAVGAFALGAITSGADGNCAVGYKAMDLATGGTNNTALGSFSLEDSTTTDHTTAIGYKSLLEVTTGARNTAVGAFSGDAFTTGTRNILIGYEAGNALTLADSSNIIIGHAGVVSDNNTIRLGTNGASTAQQNKCFIAGIRGVTTGVADAIAVLIDSAHQLGTVSSSLRYKENVSDLGHDSDIIYDLRPVKFNYKKHPDVPAWGLIAEEVDKVFPQLVVYDEDKQPETVKYHDLSVLMLNELKKLNDRIGQLEEKLSDCVCER